MPDASRDFRCTRPRCHRDTRTRNTSLSYAVLKLSVSRRVVTWPPEDGCGFLAPLAEPEVAVVFPFFFFTRGSGSLQVASAWKSKSQENLRPGAGAAGSRHVTSRAAPSATDFVRSCGATERRALISQCDTAACCHWLVTVQERCHPFLIVGIRHF